MLSAIILAAGQSKRMGQPKLLLPWGHTTVLGKVIETLQSAGVAEILAVTGGARAEVEKIAASYKIQVTHNANKGEMLESIQIGIKTVCRQELPRTLGDSSVAESTLPQNDIVSGAVLIALGDQPQVEEETAKKIIAAWKQSGAGIIMPSYQNRRGHPWLIAEKYWGEILNLPVEKSMRDFFKQHHGDIFYVNVETPSILQDLDTPEDYLKFKPQI